MLRRMNNLFTFSKYLREFHLGFIFSGNGGVFNLCLLTSLEKRSYKSLNIQYIIILSAILQKCMILYCLTQLNSITAVSLLQWK